MEFAKPVTLRRFFEWLSSNKEKTWYLGSWGDTPKISKIKYISPLIDTRFMTVYGVEIWGCGPDRRIVMQDSNNPNETLLDIVERELSWNEK